MVDFKGGKDFQVSGNVLMGSFLQLLKTNLFHKSSPPQSFFLSGLPFTDVDPVLD